MSSEDLQHANLITLASEIRREKQTIIKSRNRISACEVPSSIPAASFLTQTQTKILETGMWRYTDNAVCQPKVNTNTYGLKNQNISAAGPNEKRL